MKQIEVIQAQTEEQLHIAYRCHHDWFVQAGYKNPTSNGILIDRWTPCSDYFLAYVVTDEAAAVSYENSIGMVRLVQKEPFSTLLNFRMDLDFPALETISDENCVEVSALCWKSNYGEIALPHLFRAGWQRIKQTSKTGILANLDDRVIALGRSLKVPFQICGKTRYFMGSYKTPVYTTVAEIYGMLPETNRTMWDIVRKPVKG